VRIAQLPRNDREDSTTPQDVTSALRALLEHVVDYAGLYPPASVDLPTAARNYASYRVSDDRWMLGRFVTGVGKLGELRAVIGSLRPPDLPWPVTVVAPDAAAATGVIRSADIGGIKVESVEVKAATLADVMLLGRAADRRREVYVEVALDESLPAMLDALAAAKVSAKVRTGGVTPEAFPPAHGLAAFLRGCADRDLPFKATAGLHHPLRGVYPVTYDTTAKPASMFGFLNVFLAAILMRGSKLSDADAVALLDESDPSAFSIQDQSIGWREYVASVDSIQSARSRFATSFGSCSLREPVGELPFPTVAAA
jgi:hypothetical protein